MGTAWVTTCEKVGIVEVAKAKEQLIREKVEELTFKVFTIGYSSHFYLIGEEEKFVAAKELGITINLLQYDGEDCIYIRAFDFLPEEAIKSIDNDVDGYPKIIDFFEWYGWEGDTYKVTINDLVVLGLN